MNISRRKLVASGHVHSCVAADEKPATPTAQRPRTQHILQPQLRDLLPPLTQEEFGFLKASIADDGVDVPVIVDQDENIVDGFERQRACDELGIFCPREVRHFTSEQEKAELRVRLNCQRRQLTRKQKSAVIESYLRCDPRIADNYLASIIGVSQNTVAKVRERLVATFQIEKFDRLRGRDGKERPTKYKRIVANTAKEAETAVNVISDLPDNCDGKIVDATTAKRRSARHRNMVQRERSVVEPLETDDIKLFHCRFQELEKLAGIKPYSVNLVVPDIPYGGDFLPQIEELAAFTSRVLVDGGLFVMYCGHLYLPEVFKCLEKHLTYRWLRASVWNGDANLVHVVNVVSQFKPILVYSKGPWVKRGRWPDVSRVNEKEKDWHPWQQPLEEVEELVRYFSDPGDLVVDPCGGGFTTAVACLRQNRRCISCDCDSTYVANGQQRLAEEWARQIGAVVHGVTATEESLPIHIDWSSEEYVEHESY